MTGSADSLIKEIENELQVSERTVMSACCHSEHRIRNHQESVCHSSGNRHTWQVLGSLGRNIGPTTAAFVAERLDRI